MRALDFFEQATDCFRKALHEVRSPSCDPPKGNHDSCLLQYSDIPLWAICQLIQVSALPHGRALRAVVHLWQEPTNDVYKKALDMTAQAPQLHAELQKQIAGSQV